MNELYNEIKELIEDIVGEKGTLFELGAFSGIGWCFTQKAMNSEEPLPNIAIKEQKNAVHIYYAFWRFDEDEMNRFIAVFGRSAVGKSCIRVKKMTQERKEILALIINRCQKT